MTAWQEPEIRALPLTITLDSDQLDAIAQRVAAMLGPEEPNPSPWLTVEDASGYLRLPKSRLYKLTAARAIPHRKHEGRILFRRDELDSWLDRYCEGR
jgi:excisionase family DNA binding protein